MVLTAAGASALRICLPLHGFVITSLARYHNLMLACPKDAFVTSALKKNPPWHTLAVVTSAESAAIEVRTAMNLASFVEFFFRVDQSRSSMRY